MCGLTSWAVTAMAALAWLPYPGAAFIPLLVLIATFEAIRPLHFGAERIGRYLQVFYEEAGQSERPLRDTPSWERVAMRFGSVPGVGGHPLFLPPFLFATLLNHVVAMQALEGLAGHVISAVAHVLFAGWLFAGHRAMKAQRDIELERMRQLITR